VGIADFFSFFARNVWLLYDKNEKSDRQQKRLFLAVLFPWGILRVFGKAAVFMDLVDFTRWSFFWSWMPGREQVERKGIEGPSPAKRDGWQLGAVSTAGKRMNDPQT
jgi:hypothetical protein